MVTIFRVPSSSYLSPAKEIDACVSEYIEHVVRGLTTKEAPHLDELNASQAFSLTTIGEVEARLLGDPLELLLRQSLLVFSSLPFTKPLSRPSDDPVLEGRC